MSGTKSKIKDVWFNSIVADACLVEIDYISDEEAEKAVEKLKAWKRLKDNGFKFLNVKNIPPDVPIDKHYVHIEATFDDAALDDLDLLFGGEQ